MHSIIPSALIIVIITVRIYLVTFTIVLIVLMKCNLICLRYKYLLLTAPAGNPPLRTGNAETEANNAPELAVTNSEFQENASIESTIMI